MRALIVLALVATLASAKSIKWTGYGNDHQWTNKINWSPDQVPTEDDDVTIPEGNVRCAVQTGVNSLVMGTQVEQSANLTLYKGFVIGNGGMTVEENGNLFINTGLDTVFGQVTIGGMLQFVDGIIAGAWTIAPRATADLSNSNEKGFNGASFVSNGVTYLGGVLVFNQSSTMTIKSPVSVGTSFSLQNGDGSNVLFDSSATKFTFSKATLEIDMPVHFGSFNLQSGNVTILATTAFGDRLNIPSGSFVTAAGSATANFSAGISGAGTLNLQSASAALYSVSMTGNVNVNGGTVTFNTQCDAGILTVLGGNLNLLAMVYPQQMNFIGGTATKFGSGDIMAANVYIKTAGFTLGTTVTANKSMTMAGSVMSFGSTGALVVGGNAALNVIGEMMLTGPPGSAGVRNHGTVTVSKTLQLQNVGMSGPGTVELRAALQTSAIHFQMNEVALQRGGVFSGQTTFLTVGKIDAADGGVVKAKLGEWDFQCPKECDNVNTPSSSTPPAPFNFQL